jgi:hypothetical protein
MVMPVHLITRNAWTATQISHPASSVMKRLHLEIIMRPGRVEVMGWRPNGIENPAQHVTRKIRVLSVTQALLRQTTGTDGENQQMHIVGTAIIRFRRLGVIPAIRELMLLMNID